MTGNQLVGEPEAVQARQCDIREHEVDWDRSPLDYPERMDTVFRLKHHAMLVTQCPREPPADDWLVGSGTRQSAFPTELVATTIRDEWVSRLEDLVERRLVLHFSRGLSRQRISRYSHG